MENEETTGGAAVLTRRTFSKGVLGMAALAAVEAYCPGVAFADERPDGDGSGKETLAWTHCSPNCYGRCALCVVSRDNEVVRVETDNSGDDEYGSHQLRACNKGRSMRRVINHPDRLKYPMKRTGARGSGEFQQITWEEAIDTISERYKGILEKYGPESVMLAPASGVKAVNIPGFLEKFVNLNGGFVKQSGGYSRHQAKVSLPYLYGDNGHSNSTSDLANAELIVIFGDNYADTREGGAGDCFHVEHALEAGGARVIVIDPRFTTTAALHADQWIPIRPGTDAALAAGLAYVLITENMVDQDFLDNYCIGYDEKTLPESAPEKSDYRSYILGEGSDGTAKDPAWASAITGIPEQVIVDLAREMGSTEKTFVMQGIGIQRHQNGEQTVRAVCMLEILLGGVGLSGRGTGFDCASDNIAKHVKLDTGKNPVKAVVPTLLYQQAITDPQSMTGLNSALKGAGRLEKPIKMIFNYAGNCLTNQHNDIQTSHEILADESLVEFIVAWDIFMTDSCKYADIVLPDLMPSEQPSFAIGEYSGSMGYVIYGDACASAKFERKTLFQSLSLLAEKMGCLDRFAEGLDEAGWLERIYEEGREEDDYLPELKEMKEMHIFRREHKDGGSIAYEKWRKNPGKHGLKTPSGKIEIYSEQLAELVDTWHLQEGDVISPIPAYAPEAEWGYDDKRRSEYPLQMTGFHERGHVHSSFIQVEELAAVNQKRFWINTVDAAERGIADGDTVDVFNEFGTVRMQAKVTDRIMPGVTAMPQGYAYEAGEDGVDVGGCINTLSNRHPSPLAKGTPAHTNLVEVRKVG